MSKQNIQYVDHEGIVKEIAENFIVVEILNKSACASCHAQGVCSMGDIKAKILEIEIGPMDHFELGERVSVKLRRTLGYKALWISYLIPLIILVLLLLSLSAIGFSELVVALSIIASIIVYYLIVWLFRERLKNEFIFTVDKL